MRTPLDDCLKKFVEVQAGGIRYFGTLIEVGEDEAILKTPQRWISIPVEKIAAVREIDPALLERDETEDVAAEDYVLAADEEE